MLRMFVGFAGRLGPIITLFNSFFQSTCPSGGFSLGLSKAAQLQVPAGILGIDPPLTFNSTAEISTLGSLYLASGSSYPGQLQQSSNGQGVNTMMTYCHGQEYALLAFSETRIWGFRRQDCLAMVDFVLGQLRGRSKNTLYAPRAVAPSLARPAGSPLRRQSPSTDGTQRRPHPIAPGRGAGPGRR